MLSAQQSVHNQIEQVSGLSDDTCPVLDKPALLEQLKRQQAAYEEQLARLKEVESERNAALEAQRGVSDTNLLLVLFYRSTVWKSCAA